MKMVARDESHNDCHIFLPRPLPQLRAHSADLPGSTGQAAANSLYKEHVMKQVWRLCTLALAVLALWIALLNQQPPLFPQQIILTLPLYAVVVLGCYGLAMVGYGLMVFPTCPQEAVLLQKDIAEAKEFLQRNQIDIFRS
ncbi:hypothetical protein GOP47_0023072 [Adiantum capillus-veneris]|uniref:Dolichol-phosphate mannosyltransferase subunit 3 n=1 Tax=Adiantum capillus-veneris TaxID=13818 RepID=A0A9D4U6S9_ADICA|nr:hypothetical protein GOP47_0023072 [Adiantum capillus-veneris]